MMNTRVKKLIQATLEQLTVKIATDSNINKGFKGTGFFITTDGYILTAWHCIEDAVTFDQDIWIECDDGERYLAQVDENKSIETSDIAILKINCYQKDCVPLGYLSKEHRNDKVISVGYPGIDKIETKDIGSYEGKITRFIGYDGIEIHNAIVGSGQSGGLIYHYATHRIVGVVKNIYTTQDKGTILQSAGSAVRFDCLFKKWTELVKINKEIAQSWDKCLSSYQFPKLQQPIIQSNSLLWYLINRCAQEMQLDKAIQQHLADPDNKKRPLLCLVHGDEREYDPFVDWLKYIISRMVPTANTSNNALEVIPIRTDKIQQITDLHDYIWFGLKNKLLTPKQVLSIPPHKIEHTIAQSIAIENRPMILYMSLHTEDGQLLDKQLIEDGFIKFWAQWQPNDRQNQLLLVFLLFKYQAEKITLWQRLLLRKPVNKKLEQTFKSLEKLNFLEKFAVNGIVLPKLDRIKKPDVIDWVKEYYEEHLNQFCSDKHELINAIDDMYADYPDGISMRQLIPKLKKIVLPDT